jgi:hypothetical protein
MQSVLQLFVLSPMGCVLIARFVFGCPAVFRGLAG